MTEHRVAEGDPVGPPPDVACRAGWVAAGAETEEARYEVCKVTAAAWPHMYAATCRHLASLIHAEMAADREDRFWNSMAGFYSITEDHLLEMADAAEKGEG